MRRWTWFSGLAVCWCLGCGQPSAPPATEPDAATPSEASSPDAKPDPTPILPIPDDAPGTDPDAESKVPIKPIPDEPAAQQ